MFGAVVVAWCSLFSEKKKFAGSPARGFGKYLSQITSRMTYNGGEG
jgi:hypothetical protein